MEIKIKIKMEIKLKIGIGNIRIKLKLGVISLEKMQILSTNVTIVVKVQIYKIF